MALYLVTEVIENKYVVEALSEHKAIRAVLDNIAGEPKDTDVRVNKAIELVPAPNVWEDSDAE